jgi:hypothetical protein
MNTSRLMLVIVALVALSGCHPSATEKQDVLDGMAFAQDSLPLANIPAIYGNFLNSGEFLRRSKYFKAGADYRAILILDQVRANLTKYDTGEQSLTNQVHNERMNVVVLCSKAWNTLDEDLKGIPISRQDFGAIVGDKNTSALAADDPFVHLIGP